MRTFLLSLSMLMLSSVALAQSYSIAWSTADGGGGTSTGGVYSLSGTIGQPDAHASSGGVVTLTGGFWAFTTGLQAPEPPRLTIRLLPRERAGISWSPASARYRLQATGPRQSIWLDVPSGSTNPVVIPTDEDFQFFRLRQP